MNLTTTRKVKMHLGIPLTDSSKDALIAQIIRGVSGFVETYTNRKFGVVEYSEIRDGAGEDEIFVNQFPIREILSITIDGNAIDLDSEEEAGTVIIDTDIGSIYREGRFAAGRKNVKVVYTAGFDEPVDEDLESGDDSGAGEEFPNALEGAVIRLTARVYERRTAEGVSSVSPTGFSVSYKDAIDADVAEIIDSFAKRRL